MKWLDALKAWNEQHGGRWTIPKKGSPEYDAVRALQGAATPTHPTPPRAESPEPDSETERIVDEALSYENSKPTFGEALAPIKVKKSRKPKTAQ